MGYSLTLLKDTLVTIHEMVVQKSMYTVLKVIKCGISLTTVGSDGQCFDYAIQWINTEIIHWISTIAYFKRLVM